MQVSLCGHTRPVFACESCIQRARASAEPIDAACDGASNAVFALVEYVQETKRIDRQRLNALIDAVDGAVVELVNEAWEHECPV